MEEEENGQGMGTGSGSGSMSSYNEQVGLVNANAQLNVSLIDSGAAAGGVGLGSGLLAAATPAAATGFVAAVPVIGQVVAIGAAIVGIVQIFDTAQKQANMADSIKSAKQNAALMKKELAVIGLEYSEKLTILKEDIAYREKALATNRTLLTISGSVLGVSAMVFAYSLIKLKRK